jgi:hypothetical protein
VFVSYPPTTIPTLYEAHVELYPISLQKQGVLGRSNRLLSFDNIRSAKKKRRLQRFFVAAGTSLPSFYLATIGGYKDRPTDTSVQQLF